MVMDLHMHGELESEDSMIEGGDDDLALLLSLLTLFITAFILYNECIAQWTMQDLVWGRDIFILLFFSYIFIGCYLILLWVVLISFS